VTAMRLRVTVPLEPLVDTEVSKVTAEAVDGWFCLLPRHIDLVTTLVAGVLVYETPTGQEAFVALDESVLVKCGDEVLVSAPRAVAGAVLGELRAAVEEQFRSQDEREILTRAAVRKLEATFLRGLMDLEEVRGG
jgi:F-type H+-transporting ATPase subunit epsilon